MSELIVQLRGLAKGAEHSLSLEQQKYTEAADAFTADPNAYEEMVKAKGQLYAARRRFEEATDKYLDAVRIARG